MSYKRKKCTSTETYIEQRLYQLCSVNERKKQIYYEWQANKQKFTKMTQTIIYDYQYYSLHDQTHSRTIVESIEMFLGKDRINRLGIGDLWLILNSVYSHDIGMSTKYEEILDMWRNDRKFHKYIENEMNNIESGQREAMQYYKQLCDIFNNYNKKDTALNQEKFVKVGKDWPLYIKKYVNLIIGEYIRREHGKRSTEFLNKFKEKYEDSLGIKVAENRLYQVMGEVVYAHSQDISSILNNLQYEANGFGNEKMHPQFVAAMLCLGDLLDMDNNRFDTYAIRYFGELPAISEVHLKKHLSITHLRITEQEIEAVAESNDIAVCKEAKKWFSWLEGTLDWITSHWNIISPKELGGCIFKKHVLQVFLRKHEFEDDSQTSFTVDKNKLIDLLIGDRLYEDTSWIWIREYLQNALDATKLMLWIKAKENEEKIFISNDKSIEAQTPLDFNYGKLDEYAIEFIIEMVSQSDYKEDEDGFGVVPNEDMIKITIKDKGIGLEKSSLNVIKTIGASWRYREEYKNEVNTMLNWLKPTGGFGIGLQSGFISADEIEIKTRGIKEDIGYRIRLKSPRIGGEISRISSLYINNSGTSVIIMFPIRTLQKINYRGNKNKYLNNLKSPFDYEDIVNCLYSELKDYIKYRIPNNMIPIDVVKKDSYGMCRERVESELYKEGLRKKAEIFENDYLIWSDYKPAALVAEDSENYKQISFNIWLWSIKEQLFMQLKINPKSLSSRDIAMSKINIETALNDSRITFCFKNALVDDQNRMDSIKILLPNTEILVDFVGMNASECLSVNRDMFNNNFDPGAYTSSLLGILSRYFIKKFYDLYEINKPLQKKEIQMNRDKESIDYSGIFGVNEILYIMIFGALTNGNLTGKDYFLNLNEDIMKSFASNIFVGRNYKYKNEEKLGINNQEKELEGNAEEKIEKMFEEATPITLSFVNVFNMLYSKEKPIVFEIQDEDALDDRDVVSIKNITYTNKNIQYNLKQWDSDNIAMYISRGGVFFISVLLYCLLKQNRNIRFADVEIVELNKTFRYVSSWSSGEESKLRSNETLEKAIEKLLEKTAIGEEQTIISFSKKDTRFDILTVRKKLNYVENVDCENSNVIFLPFNPKDVFVLSKQAFIPMIKSGKMWKRACDFVASQFIISDSVVDSIETEYENLCCMIYDMASRN